MNLDKISLWTALITPLKESGEVDYLCLEKLLKEQELAGNGVLILGSTGEALNLDEEEKKKILSFTIGLKLKVPLMCGVGGVHLGETARWVEYLETLPLHAYLMVTPLYAKPGAFGQTHWFKTLMDLATKPVVLYNVPSRAGASLSLEALKNLKDHPLCWGVKEASGSLIDFKKYRETAPDIRFFSGDDAMMPDFSKHGANGLISVSSNVWPKATSLYVQKCLEGRMIQEEVKLWEKASNSLFIASNPVPVKRLLWEKSVISSGACRAPLNEKDLEKSDLLKESDQMISNWLKNN